MLGEEEVFAASAVFNDQPACFGRLLNYLKTDFPANNLSGALQRRDGHVSVLRVEQPDNLAAAGVHPLCQLILRYVLILHGLRELPCQDFLDGDSLERFAGSFCVKEIVECRKIIETSRLFFFCHCDPLFFEFAFTFQG
jgi:hypothetical protein